MYLNEFNIKEVNDYYVRRGGARTANIRSYANVGSFSGLMRRAAAQAVQASQAAQEDQAPAEAAPAARTRTLTPQSAASSAHSALQANAAARPADSSGESAQAASASGNICCEQCHATNQLMLQMMSRNLYSQSALNSSLSGYGAWTAYQNMANMTGNSLF